MQDYHICADKITGAKGNNSNNSPTVTVPATIRISGISTVTRVILDSQDEINASIQRLEITEMGA